MPVNLGICAVDTFTRHICCCCYLLVFILRMKWKRSFQLKLMIDSNSKRISTNSKRIATHTHTMYPTNWLNRTKRNLFFFWKFTRQMYMIQKCFNSIPNGYYLIFSAKIVEDKEGRWIWRRRWWIKPKFIWRLYLYSMQSEFSFILFRKLAGKPVRFMRNIDRNE